MILFEVFTKKYHKFVGVSVMLIYTFILHTLLCCLFDMVE